MDIYTNCYVTFDNKVVSEAATVKINKDPKHNVVETLAKGLAGITLGPKQMTVDIDLAVPSADFEINPDPYMETGKVVEVGVVMAGRQLAGKMIVMGSGVTAGVGQSASQSISFLSEWRNWE